MRISYKTHPALRFFLQGDQSCLRVAGNIFPKNLIHLLELTRQNLTRYTGKLNIISNDFCKATEKARPSLARLVMDIIDSKDEELFLEDIYLFGDLIMYVRLQKDKGRQNAIIESLATDRFGTILTASVSDLKQNIIIDYLSPAKFASGDEFGTHTFSTTAVIFHLFKHYSNIEIKEVCSNKKEKVKGDDKPLFNELPISILHLNSTWFTEIIRNEGFDVRGHMRWQPYKREDGEWDKKLIWIDQFRKHGYHRRAQKVIEAEEAAQ
jgi:hypothetical protein